MFLIIFSIAFTLGHLNLAYMEAKNLIKPNGLTPFKELIQEKQGKLN